MDYFGRFSTSNLGGLYTLVDIAPQSMNRKSAQKNRKIDRTLITQEVYSLNALFDRFLADFCLQFAVYLSGMPTPFSSKICRKIISNPIIKINGTGS